MHCVAVWCIPFLNLFCFVLLAFCLLKISLTCIWTQTLFFHGAPFLCRDRIQPANMGPAGRLFNICQGDQSIEEYARNFFGVAHRSAKEKTCLMIIFWGGLAEPFKSLMPYWTPEESLEDYINLALHLSGSAFRVELAAESAHSSPEAAIQGASVASSATASTSCPFPERPRLIRSMQEPLLMSVRAAWSAHDPPEAAVPAHKPSEAVVSAHKSPEAAVSAHKPSEAAVSAHKPSKAAVSAHKAPKVAVSAHKASEAAVTAHDPPEEAVPTHSSPEAAVPTHDSPEVAEPAHDPPEATVPAHDPPEVAVSAHKAPEAAMSAHGSPEVAVPAHASPEAAVSAEVSSEGAGLISGLPEAAEPATARSKVAEADTVAAPLALLWWPLVLPWVPILPALPQSPGPPPAARTWSPSPWSGAWERLEAVP